MEKYNTYKEIISQVDGWRENYNKITAGNIDIDKKYFSRDYDKIILFGCGSSYNLALAASFYTRSLLNIEIIALPSSELFLNKELYIKNKSCLLIGFSRSGETTESIKVIEHTKKFKNIDTLVFTCHKGSVLESESDGNYFCEGAGEKSIVMTKSFSNMLFSYCLILTKIFSNKRITEEFINVIDYTQKNIGNLYDNINNYIDESDFNKFFALGSGFNYGLAVEADLKVKEMTQVQSYSYYIMEFGHGPKSLLTSDSLCLFLTPNSYLKNLESLIEAYLSIDSKIIIVGRDTMINKNKDKIKFILSDECINNEIVRSFINIPVFQIISLIKTLRLGLNPDEPRNLDYTTKADFEIIS